MQERGGLLLSGLAAVSRLTLVDILLGRYGCCGDTPRKYLLSFVVVVAVTALLWRCYGDATAMLRSGRHNDNLWGLSYLISIVRYQISIPRPKFLAFFSGDEMRVSYGILKRDISTVAHAAASSNVSVDRPMHRRQRK